MVIMSFFIILLRLTNSMMVFVDLMNRVFRQLIEKCMIMLIANILMYERTKNENFYLLRIVLKIHRDQHLFASLGSVSFG